MILKVLATATLSSTHKAYLLERSMQLWFYIATLAPPLLSLDLTVY